MMDSLVGVGDDFVGGGIVRLTVCTIIFISKCKFEAMRDAGDLA